MARWLVLGVRWKLFAFQTWRLLTLLDDKVLTRVVPRGLFYNVLVTGVRAH